MTRWGNLGVENNSRTANRYAMPATASGMMKDGAPMLPSLREQIVSATSKMTPNPYSLRDGVSFTGLPCPSATVPPSVPTVSARRPFVAPWPERAAVPLRAESGRPLHQYRKKELRNLRKAQALVRAPEVSPARCWCPFRRLLNTWDEKPLPRRD